MEEPNRYVDIRYTYLRDPKRPEGGYNCWKRRRISIDRRNGFAEFATVLSSKTGIPVESLELYYQEVPSSAENTANYLQPAKFCLEDDDDFKVMISRADTLEIYASLHKSLDDLEVTPINSLPPAAESSSDRSGIEEQVAHVDEKESGSSCPTQGNDEIQDVNVIRTCTSASNTSGFKYDVFISFRGSDTRNGFTGHLYAALDQCGIYTFIDYKKLEKGQKIDELFTAIEQSAIFVPVFSKHFAESDWCLKEVTKMVECNRLLLPIFYDVEPTDVKHQTGHFFNAFQKHNQQANISAVHAETVRRWRQALKEACAVSSYVLQTEFHGHEANLIKVLVKQISQETHKSMYEVAEHPVGVDAHVEDVMEILSKRPGEVAMVGIVGMGGIGKTTIAKAIFNKLSSQFDGSCLLLDTRETWAQEGVEHLKEKLLNILKCDPRNKSGDNIIQQNLQHKKVLLILDDVDKFEQLQRLAGNRNWFGKGSKIIITTRNLDLLKKHGIMEDEIYKPNTLSIRQSLRLFSLHAFNREEPPARFDDLSRSIVDTSGGLPLALKVLGSELRGEVDKKIWEEKISKRRSIPHHDIQKKLMLSFDDLDEPQKYIFLDIACSYHIKQSLELAIVMWNALNLWAKDSLRVLELKSLITVDWVKKTISMHDQLTELGRAIAGQQQTRRLKQIKQVLDNEAKDNADMSELHQRLLTVTGRSRVSCPTMLMWLNWVDFPGNKFPRFKMEKLFILELSADSVSNKYSLQGPLDLPQLKVLILNGWKEIDTFEGMPCLERLVITNRSRKYLSPGPSYIKCLPDSL